MVDAFFRPYIEKWQARGDAVLIFQNVDLGHPDQGRCVAMPSAPDAAKRLMDRKANGEHITAPDGAHGLGWRYVLKESYAPGEAVPYQEQP